MCLSNQQGEIIMNSDNIWKVVIGAALIYVVDSYALNNLVDRFQEQENYDQLCVMDTFSNGMVTKTFLRKANKEVTIEEYGLYKYLYANRAIRKAMGQC